MFSVSANLHHRSSILLSADTLGGIWTFAALASALAEHDDMTAHPARLDHTGTQEPAS